MHKRRLINPFSSKNARIYTLSMAHQAGVVINSGPTDWTVLQQDASGHGTLALTGSVLTGIAENANTGMTAQSPPLLRQLDIADADGALVEVRVVGEATGADVVAWTAAVVTGLDWAITLRVRAGGLYRVETRLRVVDPASPAAALSPRGDMRHFVGVGDVWAIAGQSNASGYGRGPYEDPPELGVHLFNNANAWGLATHPMNESTDTAHGLNREGGNPGHSPFLQYGRLLQRELGHPIGLMQVSLGASALSVWEEGGSLALMMPECIEAAGCGGVRGILWYQGETDAGDDQLCASYRARFEAALAVWRSALDSPQPGGALCLTVQLNRVKGVVDAAQHRRWSLLREAQRVRLYCQNDGFILQMMGLSTENDGFLLKMMGFQAIAADAPGVAVVPTFDLGLTDGIHNSPQSNMLIGERLARSALGLLEAGIAPDAHLAPEASAAQAVDGGRAIRLRFDHVAGHSRMGSIDPLATPFRVEDSLGIVPLLAVECPGVAGPDAQANRDCVVLRCGRTLASDAVVHGGYECRIFRFFD